MISIKKYLDAAHRGPKADVVPEVNELLSEAMAAYRSSLAEIGNCSLDACPGLGRDLKMSLGKLGEGLTSFSTAKEIEATEKSVREKLKDWGGRAAKHYRQKTAEVKEILIVMARTAESVGVRDERCAQQINEVTTQLKTIANLEDITQIRASIERSAADLKSRISRPSLKRRNTSLPAIRLPGFAAGFALRVRLSRGWRQGSRFALPCSISMSSNR
jgi:plasmid stability protein